MSHVKFRDNREVFSKNHNFDNERFRNYFFGLLDLLVILVLF